MLESLNDIKSVQDIRVEKARMRYEALLAENKLNDSLRAAEQLFTFLSNMRRSITVIRQTYDVMTRAADFVGRLFGKGGNDAPSGTEGEEDEPTKGAPRQ